MMMVVVAMAALVATPTTHMYNKNFMCEIRVGFIIVYNVENMHANIELVM